jgi:hypothetical protein
MYKIWHFDSSAAENSGILGYEATSSETIYQSTQCNIPEDFNFHSQINTKIKIVTTVFHQTPD